MWCIERLFKVGSGLIKYPFGEYARRLTAVVSSRPFVFRKGPITISVRFIMNQAQVFPVPSVSLIEGRPATTSLDIAEHFDKRHDDVIKSIRNLSSNPDIA